MDTKFGLTKKSRRKGYTRTSLSLLLTVIMLASMMLGMIPGIAVALEEDAVFTVSFWGGVGSADGDLVLDVAAGTPVSSIAPMFAALDGFEFAGWDNPWTEDAVVESDLTFTALWNEALPADPGEEPPGDEGDGVLVDPGLLDGGDGVGVVGLSPSSFSDDLNLAQAGIEAARGGLDHNGPDNNRGPRNPFLRNVSYEVRGAAPATSSPIPATRSHRVGTPVSVAGPLTTSERTNADGLTGTWVFTGWRTNSVIVLFGGFLMPHRSVNFVGSWRFIPNPSFSVNYRVVGPRPDKSSPVPSSQRHQMGTRVTVAGPLRTKDKEHEGRLGTWEFLGWESRTVHVRHGHFWMPFRSVEFIGRWKFTPNASYKVIYVVKGPGPEDYDDMVPAPQMHQAGRKVSVADRLDSVVGRNHKGVLGTWRFVGWKTNDVQVRHGSFKMPDHKVVFFGSWKFVPNKTVRVFFMANTDDEVEGPVPEWKKVTVGDEYGELALIERDGFRFMGWSLDPEGTMMVTEESIVEIKCNHKLYAQWAEELSVTYAPGLHGTFAPVTFTGLVLGDPFPAFVGDLTHDAGWEFVGWTDGVNIYPADGLPAFVDGEITLTALWEEVVPEPVEPPAPKEKKVVDYTPKTSDSITGFVVAFVTLLSSLGIVVPVSVYRRRKN